MRTQKVTLVGKEIIVQEQKLGRLKNETLPKLGPAWEAIKGTDISQVIDSLGEQFKVIFPELKDIDIDECYPSEIEAFVEAWIEVNFTGLKRLLGPALYFVQMGLLKQGFDLENPLASLITGNN